MNLLLTDSRFFHDLQVNVLLSKIFLVLESLGVEEFSSIVTIKVI